MTFNVFQDMFLVIFLCMLDFTIQSLSGIPKQTALTGVVRIGVLCMRIVGHLAGVLAMTICIFYISNIAH